MAPPPMQGGAIPSPQSPGPRQPISPVTRRVDLPGRPESPGPSPSQLAESALSGLRSSLRRGAKGSIDLARNSMELARPTLERSYSSSSKFVQDALVSSAPGISGMPSPSPYIRNSYIAQPVASSAPSTPAPPLSPTAAELQAFPLFHLISSALSQPSTPAVAPHTPSKLVGQVPNPLEHSNLRPETPDSRFSLGSGAETPEPSSNTTPSHDTATIMPFSLAFPAALVPLPPDEPDDFPSDHGSPPLTARQAAFDHVLAESPPHTAKPRLTLQTPPMQQLEPVERSVFSPDTAPVSGVQTFSATPIEAPALFASTDASPQAEPLPGLDERVEEVDTTTTEAVEAIDAALADEASTDSGPFGPLVDSSDPLSASLPSLPSAPSSTAAMSPVIRAVDPTPQGTSIDLPRTSFDRPRASFDLARRSLESLRRSIELPRPSLEALTRTSVEAPRESSESGRENKQEVRQAEIAQAYKRLQAEKVALEKVVRSATSLSGIGDLEAFEDYLRNLSMKAEMSAAEIKRLTIAQEQTTERIEEMRDTHRLEVSSQSEQITQLKSQLEARDLVLRGFESEREQQGLDSSAITSRIATLEVDLEKAKTTAKEEEEKRIKSVSLLKALRQKLVKAEKDKEDAEREREASKASEAGALQRIESDVVNLRTNQEQQLTRLRLSYEREINQVRAQYEREAAAKRGQAELEVITVKAGHTKELALRDARVSTLERQLKEVSSERASLFDQLQLRSAEVESAREDQDRSTGRTNELEYEMREAKDRAIVLADEIEALKLRGTAISPSDASNDAAARQLLADAELAHSQRVAGLEARIKTLERERAEGENDMAKQLQERLREVERMRAEMARKDAEFAGSMQTRDERQNSIDLTEARLKEVTERAKGLEHLLEDARAESQRALDMQTATREEARDHERRAAELETRLAELQLKESQARSTSKTLREELRKIQSGMLMSDKQRISGVGYFSGITSPTLETNGARTPFAESADPLASSGKSSSSSNAEEAINFEYIRNVLLQFIEHREMRPHLISVLAQILHFTPAETRRLTAKNV